MKANIESKSSVEGLNNRSLLALPVPLPVDRAIKKLAADLSRARRRRRLTQASLAERIGVSLNTVKRMEKGDPRISLVFIARALLVFGELERLSDLLDTSQDDIGLTLMDEQLPKRVRPKKDKAPGGL